MVRPRDVDLMTAKEAAKKSERIAREKAETQFPILKGQVKKLISDTINRGDAAVIWQHPKGMESAVILVVDWLRSLGYTAQYYDCDSVSIKWYKGH